MNNQNKIYRLLLSVKNKIVSAAKVVVSFFLNNMVSKPYLDKPGINRFRFIWRAWTYRLKSDRGEIKSIIDNLSPGDIAIDIGANKGGYTYWMAKSVGHEGKVIAFEPQPDIANYIRKFFDATVYKSVVIEPIGLSSRQGECRMTIPETGKKYSPGASFEVRARDGFHSFMVKVDTLDSYCNVNKLRPLRFIKCDVEGHELEVFKGSETVLREDKPVILFECEARHLSGFGISDVFSYLNGLGYTGYFFMGKKLLPVSMFDEKIHQAKWGETFYFNNFLFKPNPI